MAVEIVGAKILEFPKQQNAESPEGPRHGAGDRTSALSHAIAARIAQRATEAAGQDRRLAQRRQEGRRVTPDYYAAGTAWGAALEAGESAPLPYARGCSAPHDAKALRFNEREEALRLAIEQLNAISHLVRFGGLQLARATARPGYDETKLHDHEANCLTDLAETMVKLRAFGAVA